MVTAWVQYTWDTPVMIYQSNAYYFTDGNFLPKDVSYQYQDESGTWRDLPNVQGCGTELDKYNVTTFDPVYATAIRMNMTPKTLGCGVIEWQVMGYADNIVDKVLLRKVIDDANALNLNLFVMTDELKAALDEAKAEAKAVFGNKEATQEEVDAAVAKLSNLIISLPTKDGNMAYSAAVSTTYVSGWEKLEAVRDGKVPANSYNPSGPRYGTWGNASGEESVTYTWNTPIKLQSADIYFWYDGEENKPTSGGIQIPKEYYYEYLDAEGNWQKVANPSAYTLNLDGFNNTTFDEVSTTAIRVTMKKQVNDGNGVGIVEWKVYGERGGEKPPVDREALLKAIESAEKADESLYTEETWSVFAKALENAKAVAADENATDEAIENAVKELIAAQNALEEKPEDNKNIASLAKADGICDYVDDLGGLATLNDGIDPSDSGDKSNGTWHNWNHRYDEENNIQNAWLSYTWDETVILESTDVYYFSDGGGIQMPKAVSFEYLDENGEWTAVEAESTSEENKYNTTQLGNIKTTAIRMTMEPQFLNDNDPACGIGVIEWKVNGSTVPSVDKEALAEAIEDAKKVTEKDKYTAESWEVFETALKEAQKVYDKEDATQEEVDAAVKALKEAQGALVEAKPEPEPELEGWVSTENGWEYYEDGQKAVGWKAISGEWYYFNENGIMATGWVFVGNHYYYMDQWGAMLTGWVYVDGHYYYMDQWGAMLTGWVYVDGHYYYMDQWGAMLTGWVYVDGHYYYMDQWGTMLTDWVYVDGHYYYMDQWGTMLTDWVYVDGHYYYMDQWGTMLTGWVYVDGHYYYMDQWGAMRTGWVQVGNDWYYMNADGAMASNQWIGGYYVDESGKMV